MKITERSIDDYLESIDDRERNNIIVLSNQISKRMPGIVPKLWEGVFWGGSEQSIIGFGDLTYTRSDKKVVQWFIVGLTVQKNYTSVYITATEDGEYVVKKYGDRLGKAKLGSSSISFKKVSDINIDELLKLVDIAYQQLKK